MTLIDVRIVLAMIGFAARLLCFPRQRRGRLAGTHDGIVYSTEEKQRRKGRTEHWLGMPLRAPAPIRIHDEEPLDRWRRGVVIEKPTSRAPERLHVTCHHPVVNQLFEDSAELRAAVLGVFERAHEIHFDGAFVWARLYNPAHTASLDALAALQRASAPLEGDIAHADIAHDDIAHADIAHADIAHDDIAHADIPGGWRHSYRWKVLLVESAIWALVGYTFGGAVELVGSGKESIHVELAAILLLGLLVAIGLFAVVLAAVVLWLRCATRGYDAFLLHAFLLFALLPGGVQLASDLNRGLDGSASTVRRGVAARCEEKRAKGGPAYLMAMKERQPPIPDEVRVAKVICDSIAGPTPVTFTLGQGFLGLKWYRQIATPTADWTP